MKRLSKLFCVVSCLLFNVDAFALQVTLNDIKYELIFNSRTAEVVGSSLSHVVVPETIQYDGVTYTVTSIGEEAFKDNKIIVSIKTGNTIQYIGTSAFFRASNLEIAILGNVLKRIEDYSFDSCTKLKYVIIPQTISYISNHYIAGYGTFYGCPATIICLKEGFDTGRSSQTIYPSSFFSFSNTISNYNGKKPNVNYTFNGIGFGFQPTAMDKSELETNVGSHTSNLKFTIANEDTSFDVDIPYTYKINPVTLKAKVKNASRFYGNSNPNFSSSYSGFVNNENESALTSHGSYTTTASATSNVGTYTIKQSGAKAQNYVFEYENGTLTVNKAPLSATVNNSTKVYGSNNPTFTINYSGLKNGETVPVWITAPTFQTDATKQSGVGQYAVKAINAVPKNYNLSAITAGTLTITPAPLTIKANNASRLYFEDNPSFSFTCSGFQNNETSSVLTTLPSYTTNAVKTSNVGTYTITPSGAKANNYTMSYQTGTLTISKRNLTATPNSTSREYGDANPNFTISYSGFVNNETQSAIAVKPSATSSAMPTSPVGNYTINLSGGSATNYNLILKTGTLTVTKAPLSARVYDETKVYGSNNPYFAIKYSGLKNGETTPEWTTYPSFQTTATIQSGVGEYAVNVINAIPKNYNLSTIIAGTLTITPAPLTIQANNATRLYYNDNPSLNYTCSGFKNNENESVLVNMPILSTSATKTSDVGSYTINVGGTSSPNYSISYISGTLSITPRTLTASVGNYSRPYNENNPDFEVLYSGFVGGQNKSVLNEEPTAHTTATKTSNVGTYQISVSGGSAKNYTFNYTSGTLTINKAEQTISWYQDLSNLNVGDYVKLNAVASSGLPITYTIDNNIFAEIYYTSGKSYLNCLNGGMFVISAVQSGNNNYYSSPVASKSVTIIGTTMNIATSNAGYATFFDSNHDYVLPYGLSAQVVTNVSNKKLSYKTIANGNAGGIVPKGTAVMLVSDERRSGTFALTATAGNNPYSGTNLLHGSDVSTTTTGNGYHYKLSYGKTGTSWDNVFGWYWGAQDGAPFQIESNKAWLVVPASAITRASGGYTVEGDATDVIDIEPVEEQDVYYDLQGRRINSPTRGIYIKNDKKVLIK